MLSKSLCNSVFFSSPLWTLQLSSIILKRKATSVRLNPPTSSMGASEQGKPLLSYIGPLSTHPKVRFLFLTALLYGFTVCLQSFYALHIFSAWLFFSTLGIVLSVVLRLLSFPNIFYLSFWIYLFEQSCYDCAAKIGSCALKKVRSRIC